MKPSVPISEAISLEEENLAHDEGVVPMTKAEVLVSEESVALETESLAPQESVAPQVVKEASNFDSSTPATAAAIVEPLVPSPDFPINQA